jgi:DNA-binding NtrC family response regulator
MDILLVERDRYVRDQIKVGLQQFPEITVTWGEGYAAINDLRQREYDAVFLGLPPKHDEATRLLEHLRSIDRTTELVVITGERLARDMAREKAKFNIASFVATPIRAEDFFRTVARMRERRGEGESARPAPQPRVGVRG